MKKSLIIQDSTPSKVATIGASVTVLNETDTENESLPEQTPPLKIAPIRAGPSNWRQPQKLYYSRATHPDVALEEKLLIMQNNYNGNNIYEWNIDGCSEYNIMYKLQQMTMVATAYKTSHNCSDQLTSHILVTGFT
jgi:hypothetical protein